MDGDVDLWAGKQWQWPKVEEGVPDYRGFRTVTSNAPRVFADKLENTIVGGEWNVRVLQGDAQKPEREMKNAKEMFCLGMLQSIDERLGNLMQPPLRRSLVRQNAIRGRWAQRVLIVKEDKDPLEFEQEVAQYQMAMMSPMIQESGQPPPEPPSPTRSYADVTAWDPRNTYWGMGRHGLAWACHKWWKSRAELFAEYGMGIEGVTNTLEGIYGGSHQTLLAGYDFLDEQMNVVFTESKQVLKPPTAHGMARLPASIGKVAPTPNFQYRDMNPDQDYEVLDGDSIYHANREIYDKKNFLNSLTVNIVDRSLRQSLAWQSKAGNKLPDDKAILAGQNVAVGIGELPVVIPTDKLAQEAQVLYAEYASMQQQGSFSDIFYGIQPFQMSGLALNTVKEGGLTPIDPVVEACTRAYKQILDLLCDSYATGRFDTMSLSGRMQDARRTFFKESFTPDVVGQGGIIEVTITPRLPEDEAQRVTVAKMLTEHNPGEMPLASLRHARENALKFQNVDQLDREVREEQAQSGSPEALAYTLALAAHDAGDEPLAMMWETQYQMALEMKRLEYLQLQMAMQMGQTPPGGGAGGGNGKKPGPEGRGPRTRPSAQVAAPRSIGAPTPRPTPQAGPLVEQGRQRPGAQGQPA
jgi:hypothetical protein